MESLSQTGVGIAVVSEDEMQKLRDAQERHELEELRASLRLASIQDAKERFAILVKNCETLLKNSEEAYVTYADDEDDDFETRQDKSEKIDDVEREHARCIAIWENQLRRLNWEARQARETL